MILKKELYLIGMIVCSIALIGCYISTATDSFVLSHEFSDVFPDIDVKVYEDVFDELAQIVRSSKREIHVIVRSRISKNLLELFREKEGITTIYYSKMVDSIEKELINYNFAKRVPYSNDLEFNCVLADDTVFIAPLFFNNTAGHKILRIKATNCKPLYKDIKGFLNFFVESAPPKKLPVYNQSLIGHSTAVRPTIVGENSFFMMHQPSRVEAPLRISTNHVIHASASRFPKRVYFYGNAFVRALSTKIQPISDLPSVFLLIRMLQLGSTEVKALLNPAEETESLYALSCHNDTYIKLVEDDRDQDLNFMIMDDEVFLFSCYFSKLDDAYLYSLHMEVRNPEVKQHFLDIFENTWNHYNTSVKCNFNFS